MRGSARGSGALEALLRIPTEQSSTALVFSICLCMSQYEARRGDANGPGAQCQLIGTMPVTLLGWPWMLRCTRLSMPLCSRPGVPVRLGAQGDVWRVRGLGARVSAEFADVCVDVVGGPSAREGLPGLAGSSLLDRGCRGVRA